MLAAAAVAGVGLAINALSKARNSRKPMMHSNRATARRAADAPAASDGQSTSGMGETVILAELEVY